jgi:Protein of unknown function (DUF1566)
MKLILALFVVCACLQSCTLQPQKILRYTLSANGQEVTDNQTGLTWRRCVEGMTWDGTTCSGTALTFTYEDALQRVQSEAGSNSTAWRLPSIKELASIVNGNRPYPGPTIDTTYFPATPPGPFWSASPNASNSSFIWVVYFRDGKVHSGYRYFSNNVRLVRAGQ